MSTDPNTPSLRGRFWIYRISTRKRSPLKSGTEIGYYAPGVRSLEEAQRNAEAFAKKQWAEGYVVEIVHSSHWSV